MIPTAQEVSKYLKDALSHLDAAAEKVEKLLAEYFPTYIEWLTELLSGQNSFVVLSASVAAIFVLVIYIWFRNK